MKFQRRAALKAPSGPGAKYSPLRLKASNNPAENPKRVDTISIANIFRPGINSSF
ncbi:hypothetical protein N824_12670 [Pedobacter sp. V48]|nr:hypothetical protein N824_12670 [Pedobacter sp. V48]